MRRLLATLLAAVLAGCAATAPRDFDAVTAGMSRDDTLRILGKPDEAMRFPLTGTESWDWFYQDPWGYLASLSVTFGPDGRVGGKLTRRLNDGGDHGSH